MCEYTDTHARMHVHVEVRGQLQVLVLGSCSHQLWRPSLDKVATGSFLPSAGLSYKCSVDLLTMPLL